MNDLTMYEAGAALAEVTGDDYAITCPFSGVKTILKRDVDFGVIPKTKQPSLFKSGAEKVCMTYGLLQRYTVESAIEQGGKDPFFFYRVRCDLIKIAQDGKEYVFSCGYGSGNTGEKRCGYSGAFDSANSTLKMAQKRSLVSAALAISGLSDLFTQDIENETFMAKASDLAATTDEEAPISSKQNKRIFAIGADAGLTVNEIKARVQAMGFASMKDIKQKDYEAICKAVAEKGVK